MKPFNKTDWYGFSGAEETLDKPALIGYSGEYIIVVDINGIGLYSSDSLSECYLLNIPYPIAKIVAKELEGTHITKDYISNLGFIKY